MTSGWLKGQLPVGRCDRRRADAGGTFPQQPHMPPGGMSSPQTDDVCSSSEPMSDAPRATSSRSASTSPAQSWLQATATSRPDQSPVRDTVTRAGLVERFGRNDFYPTFESGVAAFLPSTERSEEQPGGKL